jgi:hypothetical protein
MNALGILTRHKLEGKTVLKFFLKKKKKKKKELNPKLSEDIGFFPQNLSQTHNFSQDVALSSILAA